MFSRRIFSLFVLASLLSGCMGSLARDDAAAKAKVQMLGMSKEDVLACMGIPKKKAAEGKTEVWSYASTDGYGTRTENNFKVTSFYTTKPSSHERSFCTVNVVMKDGVVGRINYLGPTATSFYNDDDQCGYAVAACVR